MAARERPAVFLFLTTPNLDTDNLLDPAVTVYAKIEKEISDIKFALSLMIKHGSTSVPTDERNKITDNDILILCEYSKALLLELLFENEKTLIALRQSKLTTTSLGKFISVLLHIFKV